MLTEALRARKHLRLYMEVSTMSMAIAFTIPFSVVLIGIQVGEIDDPCARLFQPGYRFEVDGDCVR